MSTLSAAQVLTELQQSIEAGDDEPFVVPAFAAERLALRFSELPPKELGEAIVEVAAFAGFLSQHKQSPSAAQVLLAGVELAMESRSEELQALAERSRTPRRRGQRFLGVA